MSELSLFDRIKDQCMNYDDSFLPDDVVRALREHRGFSLLLPEALGGPQMPFPDYLQFAQSVATLDGSAGWCVTQGSVLASLARLLPHETARKIWVSPDVSIANGPPVRAATRREGNDFILSGCWTFSSGINHSDWLLGVASLKQDGQSPRGIWHIFKKDKAKIVNTWQVAGLKGTGSYQFEVEELSIPAEMTFEAGIRKDDPHLYQIPMNLLFACGFASVALGVSRAALNFAIDRVKKKIKRLDRHSMSDSQLTQDQIGRAEGLWQSADSYLRYQVTAVWEDVCRENICSLENRVKLRLAGTHTIRQAKAVTDIVYDLCSTDSIFQRNDIQRRFQDIHVISQHLQGRPEIYSIVGRHYLGMPVNSHLIT